MIRGYAETENNFTILRLVLALMVVLGHFKLLSGTAYPPFPFNLADAAIDCFFVVSGCLIALSYERSRSLWSFYVRRLFRLYPMYACVVLIQTAIMLSLLPGGPLSEPGPTARYLLTNLLLANFLQYDIGGVLRDLHNPGINPSLWTLKIEIGFYLIAPLICMATRRWGWRVLALIFAASAGYNLLALHFGDVRLARQLPGQMQFFAIGMAFCLRREPMRLHPVASIAIAIGFLVAWSFIQPIPPGIRPIVVAAAVYSVALCLPVMRLKRDLSYSVYLLHGPLIQTSILLGLFHDTLPFLAVVTGTVLGLAAIAERLVERPGIAVGRRISHLFERRVLAGASVA
jgi:peptidoglycan/LPS O-acetylase OafA/YrhL